MLLRQLYLANFEQRRFDRAREVSQQALELGVLRDVVHQDAARACAALGDVDAAAGHLRLAARHGPPSLFFNASRHEEAVGALSRAARWGTRDKPLYQAHLAIVQCAAGTQVGGLDDLFDRLESAPSGQGYGRFVLGKLAFHQGRLDEARRLLRAFVDRTTSGRPATAIALDAELASAKRTLSAIEDTTG
jgi:tetratricopeptide (TPR) repeat protein